MLINLIIVNDSSEKFFSKIFLLLHRQLSTWYLLYRIVLIFYFNILIFYSVLLLFELFYAVQLLSSEISSIVQELLIEYFQTWRNLHTLTSKVYKSLKNLQFRTSSCRRLKKNFKKIWRLPRFFPTFFFFIAYFGHEVTQFDEPSS